jgi:aminomethyltransferase
MATGLTHTPLYDWHVAREAKVVDFAGWAMPVQYASIVAEHTATRTAAGMFDISHMGRFRFRGAGAAAFLDRIVTRRVSDLPRGGIRYSLVVNEEGGILDDVLVYHLENAYRVSAWWMVVNAGNRRRIAAWIGEHLSGDDVSFADLTADTAMIAVQGPRAIDIAQPLTGVDLVPRKYYTGATSSMGASESADGIVSRTGYTGEDGCELILPASMAVSMWERLLAAGASRGLVAAGLGARDTLRLEAGMPLYGHELSESLNPWQAGLAFAVDLQGREFLGSAALAKLRERADLPTLVGLELQGKRVPRQHYPVLDGGQRIGEITSGTYSPTLDRPIAMAYVRPDRAAAGNELAVDIRGRAEPARVVKLPFYKRKKA